MCILAQFEGLKESLAQVTDNIINGVKNDLDNQHLGSQSYFDKEEIIQKMSEMHQEMLKKVEVFGRRSATLIQGQSVTSVEVVFGADTIREQEFEVDDAITIVEAGRAGKGYQYFYSKGKISRLPANFVFPQMTLCLFITSLVGKSVRNSAEFRN